MRTLVPADTLVYLETNDLGAALQPIVDSKPFNEIAKRKPDLSALNGVQMAVAVTGFETKEEKLTDEHSVGRIQPHFVAVADTHAWNYQAVAFAEQKLGGFVEEIYDSEPTLEKREKNGGHNLTWTAKDGRKAFAFVSRSLIYFGNDESAIDKCLAVARGEADSIAKAGKLRPAPPGTLAFGYVGPAGVAQIANLFALKVAHEASDDSEVQSAVAGVLPHLLKNSITDVAWTATRLGQVYEDRWQVDMPADVASVFAETMAPEEAPYIAPSIVPPSTVSLTEYNLRDPLVAWRSLLLVASKQADKQGAQILIQFSSLLFEPYGVDDPEMFLTGVRSPIVTAKLGGDGDRNLVIAGIENQAKIEGAIKAIDFKQRPEDAEDGRTFRSENLALYYPRQMGFVAIGSPADLKATDNTSVSKMDRLFDAVRKNKASVVTVGRDTFTASSLVEMFTREGSGDTKVDSTYVTETRFTKTGIERRTTSDFGFIGWIIAQLNED